MKKKEMLKKLSKDSISSFLNTSKKLNASQLDELKQALKFVAKHKRRSSQLITIRAQHVAALTAELPSNVRVEIQNQKWIYLKPKK